MLPSISANELEADAPAGSTVQFFIGRGGGGHTASARAVRDCLLQQGVPWAKNIEFVDTGYLFDSIISGRREKGYDADELYNSLMSRGWYRLAAILSPLGALIMWLMHGRLVRGLERFWRARPPFAVVCFVPVSHTAMREALLRACPSAPLITVITDMESSHSHCWMAPYDARASVNQTIVAGSATLRGQAAQLHYPPSHVLSTSGMVIHPALYESVSRHEAVATTGNDDESGRLTSAVVFFGGYAPIRVESIVVHALRSHPRLNLVVLCGGNTELLRRLDALNHPRCHDKLLCAHSCPCSLLLPVHSPHCALLLHLPTFPTLQYTRWYYLPNFPHRPPALHLPSTSLPRSCSGEGFITAQQIRDHFCAADFVIGKPGPGVVAEALVCNLPFVTEVRGCPR